MITVVKSQSVQTNFRSICDQVWSGLHVVVSRPKNKNVVVLAEPDYQTLIKKNNTGLDATVDQGWKDMKASKGVVKNI
ncbi:MAG: hypothetical protein LBL38_01095 [Lactobacillales bacterium]|jgi:hypothetical protein|nr:hypothetical protein [Lactobacillales bacterium]